MKKNFLTPLEKKIFTLFLKCKLKNNRILIAVSGGLDSMSLLEVFNSLPINKNQIGVAHFHHGLSSDKKINQFRNQNVKIIKKYCDKNGIDFYFNKSKIKLKTESEFRNARYLFLNKVMQINSYQSIVTAHHAEDLLETRLHRLIRGTGPQGLVGIKEYSDHIFRPLLSISKSELLTYSQNKNLTYQTDPTNHNNIYYRNWIRNFWLFELEKYQKGSVKRLAKSLNLICDNLSDLNSQNKQKIDNLIHKNIINRNEFKNSSLSEKRNLLATFLRQQKIKNYTASHLEEIIKRLGTSRNFFDFSILKTKWEVNAEYIVLHARST